MNAFLKRLQRVLSHRLKHGFVSLLVFLSAGLLFLSSISSVHALSIEEETAMGQQFAAQVNSHFEIVEDDFCRRYINALGQYLLTQLETRPFAFRFYIINNNTLNAFAGPGGHIYFFSGLIETVDTLDELASVMSHEIGHVSARHVAERFARSRKMGMATIAGVLAGVAMGGNAGTGMAMGSMAAGQQAQLAYSRLAEYQADQISFKLMAPSGFDPGGIVGALDKITRNSHLGSTRIPTYLLTHPTGPERMAKIDAMRAGYQKPSKINREAARLIAFFPYFQTIIRARCHSPMEAEQTFLNEIETDPDAYLPHYGLGLVYKQKHEHEKALHHFDLAVEKRKDFPPLLTSLGRLYQMKGEDEEAIPLFEKALEIEHNNRDALFALGVSYQNLEQYGEAVTVFERLVHLRPVENEVYRQLGISYGRDNQLAPAHYNFGIFFMNARDLKKARFHFETAKKSAGDNADMLKKINDASARLEK